MEAPGELQDVELEVRGWTSEEGETVLICRLVDGSWGEIPARWTDLPWRARPERVVGGVASPAGWRLLLARAEGCGRGVRGGVEPAVKTEAMMSGQLALVMEQESVVSAAVWETLPPELQRQVALRLARLLACLVEAARDE